jgi:hypothetical protein
MSTLRPQDRVSLCRFTYSDHRKCLTPRAPNHPHFCFFHSRQESRARAADNISNDLAYFFSGEYLSANDLCAALGRLMPAVARGDIKPRTASTLAYLAQTLSQTIHLAEKEYIYAHGAPAWGEAIRQSVASNSNHYTEDEPQPTPHPESAPDPDPVVAGLQTSASSLHKSESPNAAPASVPPPKPGPSVTQPKPCPSITSPTASPKTCHPDPALADGHREGSAFSSATVAPTLRSDKRDPGPASVPPPKPGPSITSPTANPKTCHPDHREGSAFSSATVEPTLPSDKRDAGPPTPGELITPPATHHSFTPSEGPIFR